MPSIARTLALILVVGGARCSAAEAFGPNERPYGWSEAQFAGPVTERGTGFQPAGNNGQSSDRYAATIPREGPGSGAPLRNAPANRHKTAVPVSRRAAHPVPFTRPGQKSSLPLRPPGPSRHTKKDRTLGRPSVVTVAGSLAVVLGIFFLVAWVMRRAAPAGSVALPGEVFEVLGRAPMASRQQVHLLRCGNKLVLVSVTPAGAETLTEITDPIEVDRLAGLCQQARPNSATAAFRQVFGQFSAARPTEINDVGGQ